MTTDEETTSLAEAANDLELDYGKNVVDDSWDAPDRFVRPVPRISRMLLPLAGFLVLGLGLAVLGGRGAMSGLSAEISTVATNEWALDESVVAGVLGLDVRILMVWLCAALAVVAVMWAVEKVTRRPLVAAALGTLVGVAGLAATPDLWVEVLAAMELPVPYGDAPAAELAVNVPPRWYVVTASLGIGWFAIRESSWLAMFVAVGLAVFVGYEISAARAAEFSTLASTLLESAVHTDVPSSVLNRTAEGIGQSTSMWLWTRTAADFVFVMAATWAVGRA